MLSYCSVISSIHSLVCLKFNHSFRLAEREGTTSIHSNLSSIHDSVIHSHSPLVPSAKDIYSQPFQLRHNFPSHHNHKYLRFRLYFPALPSTTTFSQPTLTVISPLHHRHSTHNTLSIQRNPQTLHKSSLVISHNHAFVVS